MEKVPDFQRVLVLQGGGSLGAYEAGVCQALFEMIAAEDTKRGFKGRPLADIVAGTSIGAINSAVLVSYVIENNTWEGSSERLREFWEYLSRESSLDHIPGFTQWWDYLHNKVSHDFATGEAARRYYTTKEFAIMGVPNVFSPLFPQLDTKFLDPQNTWFRYDSGPLKRSLERFAKFPIATTFSEKDSLTQPRLILVSVDVTEGSPVVFDSYEKQDGSRKSEYGKYIIQDGKEVGFTHIVRYNEGITADQVIASASVPLNYSYTTLEVESYNHATSEYEKNVRYFWDGGIMSNTPLSQVVALHRQYWLKRKGFKDTVPRLNICIVNVHPAQQDMIPQDRDGVVNRKEDITYSDRTEREEQALLLISDLAELSRELIKTAKENGVKDEVIKALLDRKTMNHGMALRPRKYSDVVVGQYEIGKVIRVNRKGDPYTISNKIFDFSPKTIKQLRESGYNNTLDLSDVEYRGELFY
jgi:predicted acylesterase/phospholipase RssA